mgnify:CR=1 FL=1
MDSLNTILNSGTYGENVSRHNDNNSKIKQAITTLENVAIANKGYFDTLTSLQAAFPSPKAGDIAYVANVASTTGYYIYNVVGGAWTASTVEAPPVSVPISNYAEHGYTGTPKTLKTVEDEKASEIAQLAGESNNEIIETNNRIPYTIGDSKIGDATLNDGSNISILNTVVNSSSVKHYTLPVVAGQVYYYSTQIGTNTNVAAAMLLDEGGNIVNYQNTGATSGYTTLTDKVFFCSKTGTLIINALTAFAVKINLVGSVPMAISDLYTNKASGVVLESMKIGLSEKGIDILATGTLVSAEARSVTNLAVASTSWKHYRFAVSEGQLFYYSTQIGTNTNVATAMLIDADGIVVNYQNRGVSTGNTTVVDVPFYCKKAGTLIINALTAFAVKVYESRYVSVAAGYGPVSVSRSGDTITAGIDDYSIMFANGGNNNLYDLNTISKGATSLLARITDFMTAYRIDAVANADGDPRTDLNVGGNHAFLTFSGTPTGRQISVQFWADGAEIPDGYSGNASFVKIAVVNRIQATNTVKEDGTGREVLEEKYIFDIRKENDKVVIDITRTFTALEDIIIKRAFLCSLSGSQMTVGRFLTSNMLAPFDATLSDTFYPTGNLDNSVLLKNASGDMMITEIDTSRGYGRIRKNNSNSMLTYYSSRKAYHALVNALDLTMLAGDEVTAYGRLIVGSDLV